MARLTKSMKQAIDLEHRRAFSDSGPATGSVSVPGDGIDRLAKAVYGRKLEARDYVGGSTAQILYDAAQLIGHLQNKIKKQNK